MRKIPAFKLASAEDWFGEPVRRRAMRYPAWVYQILFAFRALAARAR